MKQVSKKILLYLIEVLVICGVLIYFLLWRPIDQVMVSHEFWNSEYINWQENEWILNPSYKDLGSIIEIRSSQNITLPKGTYTIHIVYDSDNRQLCKAYADSNGEQYLNSGDAILYENQNEIDYCIKATEDIENFGLTILYQGYGKFGIKSVTIQQNSLYVKSWILHLIILIVIINVVLYLFTENWKKKKNILIYIGITLLVSIPLLIKGVNNGDDLPFHLMRIEGIAQELKNGRFPVKLSSLWLEGYGYPVSVYYGDILLYIPAILRIAGASIVEAYKIYVIIINFVTVLISYQCFKRIFTCESVAWLCCIAYVCAPYRLVDVYTRAAVGEYSSIMFFPIIMLAIYRIYTEDAERNVYKTNAHLLAIGMTGVLGTHLLSTEMVGIVLIIVCLIMWKKTIRLKTIFVYVIAVAEAICMNLYFIIPFLDYYMHVDVKVGSNLSGDTLNRIQAWGAYIGQYFAFFQKTVGKHSVNVNEREIFTPGILLMFALVVAIVLILKKTANKNIILYTGMSIFLLYLASNIFPWNHLEKTTKSGLILAQVQFPWRYIGIAIVFLTLLLGELMGYLYKRERSMFNKSLLLGILMCTMMTCYFSSDHFNNCQPVYYYETAELDTSRIMGSEYLRLNTNYRELNGEIAYEDVQDISVIERNGSNMTLYCKTENKQGWVEIPILNYRGYHVKDNKGEEYQITDGQNNVIHFEIPVQYEGNIYVSFDEPWYWRTAEIISLISIIFIIIQYYPIKKMWCNKYGKK